MDRTYWRARLGSRVQPWMEFWRGASVNSLMHQTFRILSSKLTSFSKSTSSLQGRHAVWQYLLWSVSTVPGIYFSPQRVHPLLLLSFSQPCSLFSFGGKGLWKEVKYLGWSSDGAGNRTLDHSPPHPRPKDETTQQDSGLPRAASQNWALPRTGLLAEFAF